MSFKNSTILSLIGIEFRGLEKNVTDTDLFGNVTIQNFQSDADQIC